MINENLLSDYATKIWENDSSVAKDRKRWHTSGHHIKAGQLSIDDTIEDACEALDIIPEQVRISLSTQNWQNNYAYQFLCHIFVYFLLRILFLSHTAQHTLIYRHYRNLASIPYDHDNAPAICIASS